MDKQMEKSTIWHFESLCKAAAMRQRRRRRLYDIQEIKDDIFEIDDAVSAKEVLQALEDRGVVMAFEYGGSPLYLLDVEAKGVN